MTGADCVSKSFRFSRQRRVILFNQVGPSEYGDSQRASRGDAFMSDTDQLEDEQVAAVDAVVRSVAAELPFPVELEADMGGTFLLQIDLGSRGGPDDEHDRADLGVEPDAVWWLNVDHGQTQIESTLGRDADPVEVARWIATEAKRAGSPAALAAVASSPDFPVSAAAATTAGASHTVARAGGARSSGDQLSL